MGLHSSGFQSGASSAYRPTRQSQGLNTTVTGIDLILVYIPVYASQVSGVSNIIMSYFPVYNLVYFIGRDQTPKYLGLVMGFI